MPEESSRNSKSSHTKPNSTIPEAVKLQNSGVQYSSHESAKVSIDIADSTEKPPREWKTPKLIAFLDNQTIDVMDDFFRTFWAEIKALKLLRVALRLGIVIPIVFVWLFTVVQLIGLISDFDVWEPIADWFRSDIPSNTEIETPPMQSND